MNPLRRFWRYLRRPAEPATDWSIRRMVEPHPNDDPLLWPLDPPAQGLEEQQLADYERGKAALLARLVHDRPDKVNLPPGPHVGKIVRITRARGDGVSDDTTRLQSAEDPFMCFTADTVDMSDEFKGIVSEGSIGVRITLSPEGVVDTKKHE